ncbi:MAG: EAL domain-containing protein [Deltaproteobacteria bacterium]|nr:EAL domain-containing protein [Deltaproteobacteria bacterium]
MDGTKPAGVRCRDCTVFEATSDGIVITDVQGNIVEVNDAFCRIMGYSSAEVLGRNPRLMKSDRHGPEFYKQMWRSLAETGVWQGEVWDRRKDGEIFPKWITINAIKGPGGRVTHYLGVFSDLTGFRKTAAELELLAHYDPLTGLPNRVLFRERLAHAMALARRASRKVAVLFADLDQFKPVNDTLGHAAGDDLLCQVAARLAGCLRVSDTVSRLAGDEFTILLDEVSGAGDAARVARKLLDELRFPFALGGREWRLSVSIGIALYPDDATGLDELLSHADAAMYRAKESGRDRFHFFSRSIHARAAAHSALAEDLRRAIDQGELVLYYQPQIEPVRGRLVGVEALVRWNHPRQGLLPPAKFIPLAEESRQLGAWGDWVLREACRQLRVWREADLPPLRVAVNVAAQQFEDSRLVDRIAGWLIEEKLEPGQLELEITESGAMANPERTVERLHEMKAIGIRAAIDDFGTGYSSLAYLQRFSVDALKIDRSFLRDVPEDHENAMLCAAMIALGQNLGLRIVAEGVETNTQLEFLRERGCDELQGYLFGRPVPAAQLDMLRRTTQSFLGSSSPRLTPGRGQRAQQANGGRTRVTTRRLRAAQPSQAPDGDRRRNR